MTNRIDIRLREVSREGRTAVAPFVTIGFPDVETSLALAKTVLAAGGDMLELGIPFSDPLADGPTIQKTSFRALQQGVNVGVSLQVLAQLRGVAADAPLIFMGYLNPFMRYGLERFVDDAAEAGLDGIIVADLPTEEAGPFKSMCEEKGIYMIPLLAPTSPDERIAQACQDAKGFIYCVSLTGVTGARKELTGGLAEVVERIRRHTELPILVGFGISRREHVEAVGQLAEGAVVASALLDAIDKVPREQVLETAHEFVRSLRTAGG